jgi:hypothetical protein
MGWLLTTLEGRCSPGEEGRGTLLRGQLEWKLHLPTMPLPLQILHFQFEGWEVDYLPSLGDISIFSGSLFDDGFQFMRDVGVIIGNNLEALSKFGFSQFFHIVPEGFV